MQFSVRTTTATDTELVPAQTGQSIRLKRLVMMPEAAAGIARVEAGAGGTQLAAAVGANGYLDIDFRGPRGQLSAAPETGKDTALSLETSSTDPWIVWGEVEIV